VGSTCQLGVEGGKGGLRRWRFPTMEAETRRGASVARGPARPGEDGGSPGRSGLAQRPGSAVLIKGRKIERVLIFEFK
jgi:hypothetical protein